MYSAIWGEISALLTHNFDQNLKILCFKKLSSEIQIAISVRERKIKKMKEVVGQNEKYMFSV